MPPVVMTKVIAAATMNSGADWRRILSRFGADKNASVVTEKIRQTTTKNNAIETTLPLASIASRQLLSRTRGDPSERAAARRSCQCSALMRMLRRTGAELPPDDQVDDVFDVGVADQSLGDVAAFIHDLYAVAD